jgi:PAS domain S-box-containing protein
MRPDGSSVWVSNYVSATRDLSGQPQSLVAIVQDITERKRAEAALRESEENYRYTIELSPQIPWTADVDGQAIGISPRWKQLVGMTQEDSLGMGWIAAIHPEDAPPMEASWTRSVASGEPLDVDYRVRLADESYRWFRSRAAARRASNTISCVSRGWARTNSIRLWHSRRCATFTVTVMPLIR